jgi:uncharacterized membrane protein
MSATNSHDEARFEQFLGNLLRAGVLLSASVVLLGSVLYLVRHGAEPRGDEVFRSEPSGLRHPLEVVENAVRLDDRAIIQLGLLLLVATPVARVIFSVFGFLRDRDFTYVTLTLIVLAVLVYSLFFGEGL